MSELTKSKAWKALADHRDKMKSVHMRTLFEEDRDRFKSFSLQHGDVLFDYSKNRVTKETMQLLFALAEERGLRQMTEKMFNGDKINITEDRAVLQIALPTRSNRPIKVDAQDVMPRVNKTLAQMKDFSEPIRSGKWKGHTGKAITDVV